MAQVEQAERLLTAPRRLESARLLARHEYRQQAAARDERLLAFDWMELIVDYLEEHLTAYDARQHVIRTSARVEAVLDEVLDLLGEIKVISTKPLVSIITGARTGLLTFLAVLEKRLAHIEVKWCPVTGCQRTAFNAIAWVLSRSRPSLTKKAAGLSDRTGRLGILEPSPGELCRRAKRSVCRVGSSRAGIKCRGMLQ
jgi:hypothetical protein